MQGDPAVASSAPSSILVYRAVTLEQPLVKVVQQMTEDHFVILSKKQAEILVKKLKFSLAEKEDMLQFDRTRVAEGTFRFLSYLKELQT